MKPRIVAYLHFRYDTPQPTRLLLTDYITGYVERQGYELVKLFTGMEGSRERVTVREMCSTINSLNITTVLVAGRSAHALGVLERMANVRVFTIPNVSLRRD